ncbi:phosphoenolpyruvate synthase [Chitinophaga arvensicola]|uniref:Prodigiosin synthesizing transferase PigC n=1 Tax=Chitinophaga arvensicola TaxID=29529 RepID=A0A1I0S724_9BACT|nr:phosphoenolpyruvate synthase [Chitinophaga arvensicola]SEW51507.1 pyruvate, water dikinase [Chitinophaga arvensicola]
MSNYVVRFQETGKSDVTTVGGKGANLGELSRIEGIRVPEGFCVTTAAYKMITGNHPGLHALLEELADLQIVERERISVVSAKIRAIIENIPIAGDIAAAITGQLHQSGVNEAYAVRSSATAEDLPTASFAGQQDTYLNITGLPSILHHISRCWASLFTDRAVTYRIQQGIDHRKVQLCVVVQCMVFPEAAGILFTADPITGHRKVLSIDAGFGLGEAMVSGLVTADLYKVHHDQVIEKKIAAKQLAIYALKEGGTREQVLTPEQQTSQVLTDKQILALAHTGRKIESHFGTPQDIEWCLAGDEFYIVQSRPITTLYPVPEANDNGNHVYVSVGHNQMMTDAMKPLGLSFFLLVSRAPMRTAGGRIFIDITAMLSSPSGREKVISDLGKSDPLIKDALLAVTAREDFIKILPPDQQPPTHGKSLSDIEIPATLDPAVVHDLIRNSQASLATLKTNIQTKSGAELFDFIREDIPRLQQVLFEPRNMQALLAGINASSWINEKMYEWLGEKGVADTLSQSVPNNITSEMGLALLDVADVIRPYPAIIAYLQQVKDDQFLDALIQFDGGQEVTDAIHTFLHKYGMRCSGEIDISKTRWAEKPAILIPMILSNIRNFRPNAGTKKFEEGLQEALRKEEEIMDRLQQLPDGAQKAKETKQQIDQLRHFIGYREYPKYGIVSHYFVYKQAILKEAERLLQANVIREKEDIYYLTFEELRELVRTHKANDQLIIQRKEAYRLYEKMTPPRVITSDGEIITGRYKHDHLPANAIAGLAVSSGIIEGRARVILRMEEANLEEGDILVTPFTDPSWTALFVAIKGLVTEVGGLMTHGAVIAREYGLPAVVGVEHATRLIRDGQRIRVNGTDGFVEIL